MMKLQSKRNAKRRQGAALVEFAIVVPILFTFFFAAFEFCRANMVRHTAENAVYEAARVGILPGANAAEVAQEAERIMGTLGLTSVNVAVVPGSIQDDTEEITVRVTIPLDENSFVPPLFLAGQSIEREITMIREGVRRNET